MTNFFQSDIFAIIISIFLFFAGIIIGFFTKRLHTRDAQYISERAKLRDLFATIKTEIINDQSEAFSYILKHDSEATATIEIVCSYLSKIKGKKLRCLYEKYQKQADGKSYDPNTIGKILFFH